MVSTRFGMGKMMPVSRLSILNEANIIVRSAIVKKIQVGKWERLDQCQLVSPYPILLRITIRNDDESFTTIFDF